MFRVLVAEDDLPLQKMMCRFLSLHGYEVLPARDGIEAMEVVSRVQPDLVIADIMMPRMDGLEMIRELRRD